MKMKNLREHAVFALYNKFKKEDEDRIMDSTRFSDGDWEIDIANGNLVLKNIVVVKVGDSGKKLLHRLIKAKQGNWVDVVRLGVAIGEIKSFDEVERGWDRKAVTDGIDRVRKAIKKTWRKMKLSEEAPDVLKWIESDRLRGYRLNRIDWKLPV